MDEVLTQTEEEFGGDMVPRAIHKLEAPLVGNEFQVLLEFKGVGSKDRRLGVDLVTVLDISGSMAGERIRNMKLAMGFLLKKLGRTDRLSVVTFNRKANLLWPLQPIDVDSRKEIADLVDGLAARSTTNTEAGLRMAFNILNEHTDSQRHRAAIMLLSDGMEDEESNAAKFSASHAADFPSGKVPIYTFGLDCDFDPEVLRDIAKESYGGMFAAVSEVDNLTTAFSLSLAGLLNVAIQDLTLTIKPLNNSNINAVEAGIYHQQKVVEADIPVIIRFGSLYDREFRKVLVKLTLPSVTEQSSINIFEIHYEYSVGGKNTLKSGAESIHVTRKDMLAEAENEEVLAEEKRIKTARKMKEARISADQKELKKAREFLVAAKTSLSEVDAILNAQLDQLFHFMVSEEIYEIKGRAFALALEESHEAQRATTFTADNAIKVRMFNTPLMDQFIEQAGSYVKDPRGYKVPTEEEDRQKVALVY